VPVIERRVRDYQQPLHSFMLNGGKRAIEIAHRRWGKDEIALGVTCELLHRRVGNVWHCLPEYAQARKALWTSVNAHTGKRRIDEAFPPEIRESTNDQEMFIRFKNGSTWQMIGSDRYDATVGAGVMGITYSEWALANPSAWGYHRPMLEENDGWAMFITTPRGNNHAKSMLDYAKQRPDTWFAEVSSVLETGALTPAQLTEALAEYQSIYGAEIGRAQFEQEYLCSFNAAILGAYWGGEVAAAERNGQMKFVPIDPNFPVHTVWDLGKAINNPIWCFQVIHGRVRLVDFYLPDSDDLDEWCDWLDAQGYHGDDYVPDDILDPIWGAKHTRWDLLVAKKRRPKLVKRIAVADGIHAGREVIKVADFHTGPDERGQRMQHGIEGLKNYRREWDDERKTFRENALKDWAEHIGSSFRYLGLAWREAYKAPPPKPEPKRQEFIANPDGSIHTSVSINDAINEMIARKRKQRNA
jgi:phage terminase large subunit